MIVINDQMIMINNQIEPPIGKMIKG